MKVVNAYTEDNTAVYFIDVYGDIFETEQEASILGIEGKVVVDGFFAGSSEDMKKSALRKYNSNKSEN